MAVGVCGHDQGLGSFKKINQQYKATTCSSAINSFFIKWLLTSEMLSKKWPKHYNSCSYVFRTLFSEILWTKWHLRSKCKYFKFLSEVYMHTAIKCKCRHAFSIQFSVHIISILPMKEHVHMVISIQHISVDPWKLLGHPHKHEHALLVHSTYTEVY